MGAAFLIISDPRGFLHDPKIYRRRTLDCIIAFIAWVSCVARGEAAVSTVARFLTGSNTESRCDDAVQDLCAIRRMDLLQFAPRNFPLRNGAAAVPAPNR